MRDAYASASANGQGKEAWRDPPSTRAAHRAARESVRARRTVADASRSGALHAPPRTARAATHNGKGGGPSWHTACACACACTCTCVCGTRAARCEHVLLGVHLGLWIVSAAVAMPAAMLPGGLLGASSLLGSGGGSLALLLDRGRVEDASHSSRSDRVEAATRRPRSDGRGRRLRLRLRHGRHGWLRLRSAIVCRMAAHRGVSLVRSGGGGGGGLGVKALQPHPVLLKLG